MQLLLIRHALPLRSAAGEGSDPELSAAGLEQARRLPEALKRYPVSRVISSPQRRARQTALPVADALGLAVDVDDRLAEYDRDLATYIPIEHIRTENPQEWARMADGHLPSGVDENAFRARVAAAVADVVAAAGHGATVAVVSHGGVINLVLHEILGTARLLSFPVDYASVTRLLYSRSGRATVVAVNGTDHVWDLLPRNRR
ncbi:histidine phosphatase family protein [Mycobacterium sp.]|uniref:histidine phosphatase family protein n=1 Tax=Mycobacterium sp. TaxID=1785 RepID=UPI002BF1BC95|nr:histidine phosphatase family protein [Mycobacterium sp.]HME47385.1 histidine phosphatase family protein [Mycobacterium sp.]